MSPLILNFSVIVVGCVTEKSELGLLKVIKRINVDYFTFLESLKNKNEYILLQFTISIININLIL